MGAYYTKEDITEYICKTTIIPFLFDAAEKKCPIAFQTDSFIWRLLSDAPDRYIYKAVRCGVVDESGHVISLPRDIERGVKDVSKRDGWNKLAPEPFSLPTETWREHVDRRTRCLELRQKLSGGKVSSINDLVTLNLNLWQFARDAIVNAEGPEVAWAFWEAIAHVRVLDPTCGSGAFLFAALSILETMYSDCLECMERLVEDHAAKPHHPEQFTDFKKVLAQIDKHPNERYFVLKSIIIGNLFGVDIMEEAVEICKLRLFLKLVAQVDRVEQIEPLPDIDFNIRTGNTLVGCATTQDARRAFKEGATGQRKLMLGDAEDAYKRFEEDAESVERAFRQFRLQQTTHGGQITFEHKQGLRNRLAKLDDELDRFLAAEYGVNPDKRVVFGEWRASHQPFHWCVEFYGIMNSGGFDVIIGNPPYLERARLKGRYSVRGFETGSCRDIYAWVVERAFTLRARTGRVGLIVPVSIASSQSFSAVRDIVEKRSTALWLSHFANRPAQLFVGAQNRLTIVVSASSGAKSATYATRYHRWDGSSGERDHLMATMRFAALGDLARRFHGLYPKVGACEAAAVLRKTRDGRPLAQQVVKRSKYPVLWVRVPGYFCQFFLDPPMVRPEGGGAAKPRGELNEILASDEGQQRAIHAILNSSTYYQFFSAYTDCRHINPSDVADFPLDLASLDGPVQKNLVILSRQLESAAKQHTSRRRKSGLLIDSVDSRPLKPVIDKIDQVLAKHYRFTDEELDFIINYDIKYRVGARKDSSE